MAGMNYEIPDDLHRRCKVEAAKQGRTLKDYVLEALRQAVERDERDSSR